MQLKEEQVLGWVQDQLNRKASPHGIMDELSAAHTFNSFRDEFFFPSALIDRGTRREFEEKGNKDTYTRAVEKVKRILDTYIPRQLDTSMKAELDQIITTYAKQFGTGQLPVM